MDKRQWIADLALLAVTAIWGATFVMVKGAVVSFPVLAFLAIRFWLAVLVLAPFLVVRRLRHQNKAEQSFASGSAWRVSLLVGLALFSGYAFQTFGLRLTTPAKAGFITGLSVVMVPLFSAFLLRRPPERGAVAGVLLATLGLGLLSLQGDLNLMIGDLLILACAISFALHIIALGAYSPRMDSLALITGQIATVAILSSITSWVFERPWPALPPHVAWAALFTGVGATALAFGVQTVAQRFTSPTHTALIFAMEPVWAGLFSFWITKEQLGPRAVLGCVLILAGMLTAELAPALQASRHKARESIGPRESGIHILEP